jgi:hypothetical protein
LKHGLTAERVGKFAKSLRRLLDLATRYVAVELLVADEAHGGVRKQSQAPGTREVGVAQVVREPSGRG